MRPDKLHMFSGVHLHYEIDMCHRTASLLAAGAANGVLNDVLVESYALHLRNLIEFVYWKKAKNPDALGASDFVKSREAWVKARGLVPEVLSSAHDRANKQIAHFTKKRFTSGAPETQWRPGAELTALVGGLQTFLEHADVQRLHPKVRAAIVGLAASVAS